MLRSAQQAATNDGRRQREAVHSPKIDAAFKSGWESVCEIWRSLIFVSAPLNLDRSGL